MPYQDLTPVPYAILTRPQSELTRRTMGNITLRTAYATRSLEEKWHHTAARAYASYGARQISRCFSFVWKHHPKIPILDCEYKQVLQISQVSLFTYGGLPWLPQLTRSLRTAYACLTQKNTTILMKEGLKKKHAFHSLAEHYWNRNRIHSHKSYAAYAKTHPAILLTHPYATQGFAYATIWYVQPLS